MALSRKNTPKRLVINDTWPDIADLEPADVGSNKMRQKARQYLLPPLPRQEVPLPAGMNFEDVKAALSPANHAKGLILPFNRGLGHAYGAAAEPYPDSELIDPSEFKGRIAERKERKATGMDFIRQFGWTVKDQNGINYCWIYGPTGSIELRRCMQGMPLIRLNPCSTGSVIKKGKNQGGWGQEAVEKIAEMGLVPESMWPSAHSLDHRKFTGRIAEAAKDFTVGEWMEARPRSIQHAVSATLKYWFPAGGFSWWAHEVFYVDFDYIDGVLAALIANSWTKNWGENGFGWLQGNKMLPDDLVMPRTVQTNMRPASYYKAA